MSNLSFKEKIAKRAAQELIGPCIVNLGIGVPTLVPQFISDDSVHLHTENGMLGVGGVDSNNIDPNLVNAGKEAVSEQLGSSYFNSSESFAMIRGHHVDVSILGVLQADQNGLIANWSVPGKNIIGVGGAMDLLTGSEKVICTMSHTTRDGQSKLLKKCEYPITSTRQVDMIITDLAVFEYRNNEMFLIEIMEGSSLQEIKEKTEADYTVELKGN